MRRLNVFREYHGSYELVGSIADSKSNGPRFSYDSGYLATPNATAISRSLPLVGESFPLQSTRAFFDGLIPEGPMREAFERSTRAGRNDFLTVLEAVRNEPIGALVFSHDDDLDNLERAYEPIDIKGLERLAVAPGETAVEYELSPDSSVDSISLAGNAAIASGEVSMGVKRPNLRVLMRYRCVEGKGLVVTIDAVQDAPLEAMQLIAASGLILDDDQLEIMAHATEGYAYLIQLIRYYVWRFLRTCTVRVRCRFPTKMCASVWKTQRSCLIDIDSLISNFIETLTKLSETRSYSRSATGRRRSG